MVRFGDIFSLHNVEAQRRVLDAINARADLVGAPHVTAGDLRTLQDDESQRRVAAALAPYGVGTMPSLTVRQVRDALSGNTANQAAEDDWLSALNHIYTPVDEVGGALWLRADQGITLNGSDVSAWADQSGEGNDFSQGTASLQPIYNASSANLNGAPTVQFTAAGTHAMGIVADAVLEDGTGDGLTVFAALHQDALQTAAQNLISGRNAADTLELRVSPEVSGSDEVGYFEGIWLGVGANATTVDQTLCWRFTNASPGGDCEVFRDGVSIGNAAGDVNGLADHTSSSGNTLSLGAYRAQNQEWLNAEVAELVVYSRKLTNAEIVRVHNYMADRYGL